MATLNKVFIIGRATRDPEIRYTPKGTAVVDLGLAVNRVYSTEDGEKKEETTFVDVTLFGRQAEIAGQYLRKGSPVFLEGRLQLDTWEKAGQKHSKLKVVAEHLQLLGAKSDGLAAKGVEATPAPPTPARSPAPLTPERTAPGSTPSSARPPARVPIPDLDLDVEPF